MCFGLKNYGKSTVIYKVSCFKDFSTERRSPVIPHASQLYRVHTKIVGGHFTFW